jgi:hypothetical protein
MVEQVILLLIYIAVVVGLVWLVIWVLEYLGIAIPEMIKRVIWVIAVLVVLLLLWRAFGGAVRL